MPLRGKCAAQLHFMAYAVIRTGGKQYRVEPGTTIRVEKIDGEVGSAVTFGEVLLFGGDAIRIGTPLVDGVTVRGEIVSHARDKKVLIFKKKRRKNYRRKKGHRQHLTVLRIGDVSVAGQA